MIKLAIYWEYWEGMRLHTVQIVPPTDMGKVALIAKYGSEWRDEIMGEINLQGGPGRLIIRVMQE